VPLEVHTPLPGEPTIMVSVPEDTRIDRWLCAVRLVVRPIETRVGASVAAECYVHNSPPPVVREIAPAIKAIRGERRPSKRLRRELERMRAGPDRAESADDYPSMSHRDHQGRGAWVSTSTSDR
jgi:hypothetical protein